VPEIDASGRQLAVEQAPRGRANVVGVAEGPGEDAGRAPRKRYEREIGAGQGLGHLVDGSVTPDGDQQFGVAVGQGLGGELPGTTLLVRGAGLDVEARGQLGRWRRGD